MKKLLLFFLSGSIVCTASWAEEIRVGILTDLSAGMSSWGQQTRIGAEIAKEEISKTGGNIKLFFGDHQLQAKNAVNEFQKLTEFDKVDAIYSEFTPTTIAIAPIANSKRTPLIYSAAAASPAASSPYIFKSYLDYIQGCKQVGEYWKDLNISNVGILKANLEFGELCLLGLKQVFPNTIETSYNPGDDVSAQVILLKSKGVAAVMNATFEPDLIRMLKSMQNLDWSPQISAQDDAVAEQTRTLFPDLLTKITVFTLPTLPQYFIERVKQRDPSNSLVSISAAGLAYLHVKQLFRARSLCSKNDAGCMAREIARAEPDLTTGFERWNNNIAKFHISLRSWRQGQKVEQFAVKDARAGNVFELYRYALHNNENRFALKS